MLKVEVGQVLEFFNPVTVDGHVIAKGTRVRVGFILPEFFESKVDIVIIGVMPSKTLQVPKSLLALNCVPVEPSGGKS